MEFAGEILTDMPGKKVTIVQSGAKLFSGGTPAVPDSVRAGGPAVMPRSHPPGGSPM